MTPTASDFTGFALREEALLLLDRRGAILEAAREISRALIEAKITGAVVGGIAVVLHGHVRTTKDIDIFIDGPLIEMTGLLERLGFLFDPNRREFTRDDVPVHLVTIQQVVNPPQAIIEIEGVTTISLADLIAMKLRSGTKNLLRAQDLADVIGLARHHRLSPGFASKLPKELRPDFRAIAKAIATELKGNPGRGG